MMIRTKFLLLAVAFGLVGSAAQAQNKIVGKDNELRTITTAVPFLTISPDARASGMGDVGAATSPDVNSIHWNPAKLAFVEKDMAFGLNYTPWLSNLGVNDVFHAYLNGYSRLREVDAFAMSMRYFSMGTIQFTDNQGNNNGTFSPREYAFDAAYSRKLGEEFSVGVTGRFIHSDLTGGKTNSSTGTAKPASTAAVDVFGYYTHDMAISDKLANLSFGGGISNFGAKVSYSNNNRRDFIPTNLRLGGAFTTHLDFYNKITITADVNKLMVPSPVVVAQGAADSVQVSEQGLVPGVFGSFTDAEGGMSEEAQELMYSVGMEYWYEDLLAIRGGYFHEHQNKGNRQYFTAGFGIRYNRFGLDFSYLIATQPNNPLKDTLRFSLIFQFDDVWKDQKAPDPQDNPDSETNNL